MILISVRRQNELKQSFYFDTFGKNDLTNSHWQLWLPPKIWTRPGQKTKGNMQVKLGKHILTSFCYKFMSNINTI